MVKLLGGGSDLNTVISDMNSNLLEQKGNEVRLIYKDEQGTRVVMLDKDGLKTTAPNSGIDVFTADNNDFTFNSNQNVFKIVSSGTLSIPAASLNTGGANYASGTPQSASVAHGLSYTPAFIAYWAGGVDYATVPYTVVQNSSSGFSQYTISVAATDTDIGASVTSFGYNKSDSLYAITVKYFLLQESII